MLKFLDILNNRKNQIILSQASAWYAALALLCAGIAFHVDAEEGSDPGSALAAYDAFAKNANRVVVGVVGFSGNPQPEQWLLLCQEEENSDSLIEVVLRNGELTAERDVVPLPGQDLPHLPLLRERIEIDSQDAVEIARREVAARGKGFDKVHFQLRCRDEGNEPVWMLSLRNSAAVEIGMIYLSAESGEILRIVGLEAEWRMESSVPALQK